MTLSQLASVSREGFYSLGQKTTSRAHPAIGSAVLDALWGDREACQRLQSVLPAASRDFFQSLRTEEDPQIFFHDLLQLAGQLDQLDRPDLAQTIDQAAYNFLKDYSGSMEGLRDHAFRRIQARQGNGDFGPRAEFALSHFTREVADPASLLAMGLGPQAFRLAKFWGTSRLGASLLARFLGNGLGLLAETTTFTATHRAASAALGRPQDWSAKALAGEWASSALVLGAMRTAGEASRAALQTYLGAPTLLRLAESNGLHGMVVRTIPQLSNFLGIIAGQDTQEALGLRAKQDRGAFLADALSTLLQAKVGGDLVSGALGKGYQSFAAQLEIAGQTPPQTPEAPGPRSAWAAEPVSGPWLNPAANIQEIQIPDRFLSETEPKSSGSPGSSRTHDYRLIKQFLDHLSPELKEAMRGVQNDMQGSLNFLRTLMKTGLEDPQDRETAFFRIFHALRNSETEGDRGSYANWLTRVAFEDLQAKGEFDRLDPMLRFLIDGGSLRDYEALLARDLPDQGLLRWPGWLPDFVQRRRYARFQRIHDLKIASHSKQVLLNWAATEEKRQGHEAGGTVVDDLVGKIEAIQDERSLYILEIDHLMKEANSSPLARMRLQRLRLLLEEPDELTLGKLADMADSHFHLIGRRHPKPHAALFRSLPSQFNSYLLQNAPESVLREALKRGPALLDREKAAQRAEARTKILSSFMLRHGRILSYSHADLAQAFQLLRDPLSQQLVKSLQRKEFDLHLLDQEAFRKAVLARCDKRMDGSQLAVFIPADHPGERSMILVREVPFSSYSVDAAPNALFLMMARIVHEYKHFLHIKPGQARTQYVHFYQEMDAHFGEALWRAEYGDTEKLRTYLDEGTGGPAINFRDLFEKDYGHFFPKRKEKAVTTD